MYIMCVHVYRLVCSQPEQPIIKDLHKYHEICFPIDNLEDELAQFLYMCKREFYFQLKHQTGQYAICI